MKDRALEIAERPLFDRVQIIEGMLRECAGLRETVEMLGRDRAELESRLEASLQRKIVSVTIKPATKTIESDADMREVLR